MATFRAKVCGKCRFTFVDHFGNVNYEVPLLYLELFWDCPACGSKIIRQPQEVQEGFSIVFWRAIGTFVALCLGFSLWLFVGLPFSSAFWWSVLAFFISGLFSGSIAGHAASYYFQILHYHPLQSLQIIDSFSHRAVFVGLCGLLIWPIGVFAVVDGILGRKYDNELFRPAVGVVLGTLEIIATLATIGWGVWHAPFLIQQGREILDMLYTMVSEYFANQ